MSQHLSPKQQKLVVNEIKSWSTDRVISAGLAEALIGRYPAHAATANITGALTLIGAVLVGLGTLLFIAANWQALAVAAKLSLICAGVVLLHYYGWRLSFEPGNRPKLGAALLLLGGLVYGAGIWLIAQIFNLDANFSQGLLLWAVGVTGTTIVTRSVPLGCLASVVMGLWSVLNSDFSFTNGTIESEFPQFFIGFLTCLTLAGYLRSRAVAWISLLFGLLWMLVCSPLHHYAALLWGLALFGCYLWTREHWKLFTSPFLYVSGTATFGSLLVSTFQSSSVISESNLPALSLLLFGCLTVLSLVAWRVPAVKEECITGIGIALVSCLVDTSSGGAIRLLANMLLLTTIGAAVYCGIKRVQVAGLVNLAVVFFVFDIIARYFDFFYSMMDRSLFFILGGIVLMIVGAVAETGRRRMVEGLQL